MALIAQGLPLVPYPGLTEWQMAFRYAPIPVGLTVSNFVATASAFATAWATLASDMQTQGVGFTGSSLGEVNYTHLAASVSAFEVSQLTLSPNADLTAAWNLLVILPTMARVAALASNDPTSATSQLIAVQRYVALTMLAQFNTLLVSFQDQTPTQVRLVPVRVGDSLMDIAARELGDYTQWSALASANSLLPPYISAVPGPNVAVVGQLLYVPNGGTNPQPAIPNYQTFFLGTDIYYGPLGQDMAPWLGDLPIISGYQNLSLSLGRRLQTTLGTLIYHNTFGSRIPPEVGAIITSQAPSQISAYATSALLSDPRVQSVNNVIVMSNPLGLISVSADVIPKGPGSSAPPILVNTTIQPV
jgi:phage baseplate assembly protein W